ncbi:hypothetical protein DQ04_01821000 [Trypanosoma grayi]|uniref:hypothetical protein n=1 Tax=Trypanosoma grayi TaxID=71804 RepID=UPI0004F45A71|nr:hypothetical protein DQ04_01821000 [Trypanosoma grayi]KEG12295.1 hypothetical protein DQ04_01821000 [Trypanosoma grayi]
MFRLHSVLLIALDVVKGPYTHCCAPVNPFARAAKESVFVAPSTEELNVENNDNSKRNDIGNRTSPCVSSAAADRLSDVFVPRSEFCRRVMYLLEAESGLLYLFYPEEIAGLHYQRKTLRYTLCFVFSVSKELVTTSAALTERLVRPYSVVLTSFVEELRKAELRYGYMSRGLARASSVPSQRTKQEVESPLEEAGESDTGCADASTPATEAAAVASRGAARVNVFLTPLQDPAALQWTPLDTMIETLYACLSCEEEEEVVADPSGAKEGRQSVAVTDQQQQQQPVPTKERLVSVRLSQMHSFHVRRMRQPHVPPRHMLEEVPIPIAEYSAEVLEWADLAVHDVFKAVDGQRSIASIVQILAAGYEAVEERKRWQHWLSPLSCSLQALSPMYTPYFESLPQFKSAAELAALSPCSRSANGEKLPTSLPISPTQCNEPRFVSPLSLGLHTTPLAAAPASTPLKVTHPLRPHSERQADDAATSSQEGLYPDWWGELELVVLEALQHLEVHNYVRIVRPCRLNSTYTTTGAFYRVMCDRHHMARRIIGHRMLLVEEQFYRLREQHQPAPPPKGRHDCMSSGAGETRVGGYTVTLPAVLLTTAALERQEREEEEEKRRRQQQQIEDELGLPLPFRTETITRTPSSSSVVMTSEGVVSDVSNSLDERGGHDNTYSEAEVDAAAAAALCALGKFTHNTIANVRWEMRHMPLLCHAFAEWEEVCCKALVEIALLNGWLVETTDAVLPGQQLQ